MDNPNVYEIETGWEKVESLLNILLAQLEKAGYEEKLHIHEPPQQVEIFEFIRSGKILSIELDRRSIDRCLFRLSSDRIDPNRIIIRALSGLCAELVATFLQPLAGRMSRRDLERSFADEIRKIAGS